ncbi:Vesicle-trafficking protein SEC22b-like 1 [Homarus americanus]|uniref:Vesicle-trafficking protein SEC22b-like 1 n=1 Tax=Homarus americanus TaxID=6706 RepID=A0A8J5MQK8_HOMAM|nr:Vesicle-trafficking protein SEC22b-like 1 [Homarus americanus]
MAALCTVVGRLGDGLVMAASMDDDTGAARLIEPQARAKQLLKKLHYTSPPRASLDAPPHVLHYLIQLDVIYIAICEKSTSQERAFTFLQQVAQEFFTQYGDRVKQATRPYSFIEFDTTLQNCVGRRRRVFRMTSLQSELQDVHTIFRDNIDNVLERGVTLRSGRQRIGLESVVGVCRTPNALTLNILH